ncbi:MAG TPA: hypothetical protein VLF19_03045, partial [Methylomirabilota bacterium]|nr:hypothetical protein [Methylomirabilota bacterium]
RITTGNVGLAWAHDIESCTARGLEATPIVLDGAMVRNGMVAFSRYLEPDDVETIRAYVIQRAHDEQKRRADTR